jgi:RimJ/RimL family protein N-acetyltransferase
MMLEGSQDMDSSQSSASNHPLTIVGERVGLGPLTREMIPVIHRWFNSFETDRTQGDLPGPRSLSRATAWFERRAEGSDDLFWFAVRELNTGTPIGMVWLSDIDYRHRTAGFGISISEPEWRGKGYGTEVTRLILNYAFTDLGLRNIQLEVYANNPAGVRAYEKAGFRTIGRRHECYRIGGQVYDEIIMEAIAPLSS